MGLVLVEAEDPSLKVVTFFCNWQSLEESDCQFIFTGGITFPPPVLLLSTDSLQE
jgi:hypothetical protein